MRKFIAGQKVNLQWFQYKPLLIKKVVPITEPMDIDCWGTIQHFDPELHYGFEENGIITHGILKSLFHDVYEWVDMEQSLCCKKIMVKGLFIPNQFVLQTLEMQKNGEEPVIASDMVVCWNKDYDYYAMTWKEFIRLYDVVNFYDYKEMGL